MKNSKNKRTMLLAALLLGLLIIGYKVVFISSPLESSLNEDTATSEKVEALLQAVKNIDFDTSITTDPRLNSLISIETPLPSLPIGKKSPFSKP